jgi:hypothetical protein
VSADFGVTIKQSPAQAVVWKWWRECHDEFIPWATQGEPHILVHGGDLVDGIHHRSTTPLTHDEQAMCDIGFSVMEPEVEKAAAFAMIAGTPVHAGGAWEYERNIASRLGAIRAGDSPIFMELNYQLGDEVVINDMHHVSTTGLHHTEANGVFREMTEQYMTAAKANSRPPDVILRHHRHRNFHCDGPLHDGKRWHSLAVPGWQLKGPYTWKVGARNHLPHFGAVVVRIKHNPWSANEVEILQYTRSIKATRAVTVTKAGENV